MCFVKKGRETGWSEWSCAPVYIIFEYVSHVSVSIFSTLITTSNLISILYFLLGLYSLGEQTFYRKISSRRREIRG